jgi:hypothetical protein
MVLQDHLLSKKQVNDHFLTDSGQNLREIGQGHQKVASEQLFSQMSVQHQLKSMIDNSGISFHFIS